ncbi:MAG: winged helix-turn-helix transcriptional regulator [Nanoarchaeota archaeon]|nr:winged helix-turn-helix transcriptional regulator [Nanoarchaeota archaeon]
MDLKNNNKSVKLDLIDKKILFYLHRNYRMQRKKLSKLIGISSQNCNYRIKRLEKELITPSISLNYPFLGINSYFIFIEKLDENEIVKLKKSESIYYLLQFAGKFEYLLLVISDSIMSFLDRFLFDKKVQIIPITNFYSDNWNGFDIENKYVLKNKKNSKIVLDLKDYKILLSLINNPAISNSKISQETSMNLSYVKKELII